MVRKFAVRSQRFAVEQWRESYVPEGLHKGSDSTELAEGPAAKGLENARTNGPVPSCPP